MQENIFTISYDKNNYCLINQLGGGITDLYLDGKQILYSGKRPDGGNAFTHPCIPNFNIAKNMPNHGPARKEKWQKVNENEIFWKMNQIKDVYPQGIEAQRSFAVSPKKIKVTTTIKNSGQKDLPINIAEHNYFACPNEEIKNVKVNGKPFHPEAQKGNAQFNKWESENILQIPGIGKLNFNNSGYHAFAQWSQPKASFVCIEPIQSMPVKPDNFHLESSRIKPDEVKKFTYTIQLD